MLLHYKASVSMKKKNPTLVLNFTFLGCINRATFSTTKRMVEYISNIFMGVSVLKLHFKSL